MILRPYQRQSIDALYHWYSDNQTNPLIVMATGTGKSVVIASFIKEVIEQCPSERIICAIDTQELVEQNYLKLVEMWTFAPAGVYSAGLKKYDTKSQILFCGIQSVYNKAFQIGKADVLIVDECHMIPSKDDTMFQTFINDLKRMNPDIRIIGYTATPYRLDNGRLDTGDDAMFGGVAYEYGIKEGIADGYLSEIIPKGMATKLSVDGVGKRGGEFIESDLQKAVNIDAITKAAVEEIISYGHDRKGWLVFSSGVKHAYAIKGFIENHGVSCDVVEGKTSNGQRKQIIDDFKAGKIRCLINNAVLTKGFDAPHIDLIAALRPTQSPVLWTQMVGRGLRLHPEKENCLLLDFAQNISRFGMLDEMEFKDKKKGEGDGVPPMKECPECSNIVYAGVRICPCGYEFPPPKPDIQKTAHNGAILSNQNIAEELVVNYVEFSLHKKIGKMPSMKVTYIGDKESVSEWICFEHSGYAKQKAVQWWQQNTDLNKCKNVHEVLECREIDVPDTVEKALEWQHIFKKPAAIKYKMEGKYPRVLSRSQEELIEVVQDQIQSYGHELNDFEIPF